MKHKNTILMIAFLGLLALYIAKKTILKPSVKSFRSSLTNIDVNKIDNFTLQPKGSQGEMLKLDKDGDSWNISEGDKHAPAKPTVVTDLIKDFAHLKTKQLIAKSKDKWANYEVNDEKAKIVCLYNGEKQLSKIYIGKMDFNQQTRSGLSYARLSDEEDVYTINSFLGMSLNKEFNSFRETKMVDIPNNDITSLEITMDDKHWTLNKIDNQWIGISNIDSTQMDMYIDKISQLKGKNFATIEEVSTDNPMGHIKIESNTKKVAIDIYKNSQKEGNYFFKSDQNEAFFKSDTTGLYKTLINSLEGILKEK